VRILTLSQQAEPRALASGLLARQLHNPLLASPPEADEEDLDPVNLVNHVKEMRDRNTDKSFSRRSLRLGGDSFSYYLSDRTYMINRILIL